MNYLIHAMSRISDNPRVSGLTDYSSPEGKIFKGFQTNEAPTKYLMWELSKKNEVFDYFIVLTTDSCFNEKCNSGFTTYEYYLNYIKEYTETLCFENSAIRDLIADKYGNIENYVEKAVTPINISVNPDKPTLSELMQNLNKSIKREGKDEADLYLDFTGGSRVSCLITLMFVKFLDDFGSSVKKIVYADIMGEDKRILDITLSYEVFELVKAYGKDSEKLQEELKKWALVTDEEINENKKINKLIREENESINVYSEEEKKQKILELERLQKKQDPNRLMARANIDNLEKTKKDINNLSAIMKLYNKKDSDLIKDFYETIIGIFIGCDVIKVNRQFSPLGAKTEKDQATESVKASLEALNKYYDDDNINFKARKSSVISAMREMFIKLLADPSLSPITVFKEKTNLFNNKYKYINPKHPYGIDDKKRNYFFKYLHVRNYRLAERFTEEYYQYLHNLMNVYFIYGFPFCCTDKNGYFYKEVEEHYYEKIKSFLEKLDKLRKENIDEYKAKLNSYVSDSSNIKTEIPLLLKTNLWGINNDIFYPGESAEDFLNKLLERIEKVRPYRNAIAHKTNNPVFMSIDAQNTIATEIREWLEEFESYHFESRMSNKTSDASYGRSDRHL